MNIEEIAKQIYPDIEGYLDQIEHDRKNFIKGYNYAKTNNMINKEPEQYANDLIKKYSKIMLDYADGIKCAIIDVNNTIEGFGNVWLSYCDDNGLDKSVNFYKEVLIILESKL